MNNATLGLKSGQESCQELALVTEVRGPNVVQLRRVVLKHGGEKGWNDLLSQVSQPCRLDLASQKNQLSRCHEITLSLRFNERHKRP